MTSFDHARFSFLIVGAIYSCACSGAAPEEGEGNRFADTSTTSPPSGPQCTASHEHFIDLGFLDVPNALRTSVAVALNDQGSVVGYGVVPLSRPGESAVRAFRWKADTGLVELGTLDGFGSAPTDLNEHDELVGYEIRAAGVQRALLWDAANVPHDLGTLGGMNSYARGMNNRGQVVGDADDAAGISRPFIWDAQTGMVAVELPESHSAVLKDINDSGVAVGNWSGPDNGFVPIKWTLEGGAVELDRLCGSRGEAISINNQGEIVGYVIVGDERISVKWTAAGTLLLPPSPDGVTTMPRAINDQGTVVGDNSLVLSDTPPFVGPYTAIEWDPKLHVRALPLQTICSSAPDVNNCGDVTGVRLVDGEAHAYLWQPERSGK